MTNAFENDNIGYKKFYDCQQKAVKTSFNSLQKAIFIVHPAISVTGLKARRFIRRGKVRWV